MTYDTPCQHPNGLGQDAWFIGRDGKQYPDDEFLTDREREILETAAADNAIDPEEFVADAEDEAKRQALIRRRQARDACYECYFRTDCLNTVLSDDTIRHGTWGGYTEEQIREIRAEKRRRDRRNGET